jgi:hypothetical protein
MIDALRELVCFALGVVLLFYLPGKGILALLRIKLAGLELLFLSLVLGMVNFLFVMYLLSWLHIEIVGLAVLGVIDVWVIRKRIFGIGATEKVHRFALGLLCVFAVIFSIPLLLRGIWGNQIVYGFDDMWHISLIQELAVHFPPDIPTFAGVGLRGYHFFYDFLAAKLSTFLFISPFSLHFHLLSLLFAFLWALGVYVFLFVWSKKVSIALWGVVLTMFGGSFGYILHWQGHPQVSLSDGLGMLQPAVSIYNPPFSLSVILLVFCLLLLYHYLETRKKQFMIPFVLAGGLLPMFKVYGGIVLFGGFAVVVLWELVRKRFFLLGMFGLIGILFWGTYWIFVGGSGGLLWHPFWPPHELLRTFSWYGYDEKLYTYSRLGVYRGMIETEAYGFFLFLIGNLGTRFVGLLALPLLLLGRKKKHGISVFALSLVVMGLLSVTIPLLFLQSGKVFEIIQMASYYLFFCAIFAALGLGALFSFKFRGRFVVYSVLAFGFLAFTLPSAISSYEGIFARVQQSISLAEPYYRALAFLRQQGNYTQTVIELAPKDTLTRHNDILYWYKRSTPMVNAFANKRTYYNPTGIDFPGMDSSFRLARLLALSDAIASPSVASAKQMEEFLRSRHIGYLLSTYPLPALLQKDLLREIYNKDGYVIYQVH